jgi:hypothetical protein
VGGLVKLQTHRHDVETSSLDLEVLDFAVMGRPGHPDHLHVAVLPRISGIDGEATTRPPMEK